MIGYIYSIYSQSMDMIYIGSTITTYVKRKRTHLNNLLNNVHENWRLQTIYNEQGKDDLIFKKELEIELNSYDDLILLEHIWVSNIPEDFCISLNRNPQKCYMYKRHHTKESKDKISRAGKGRIVDTDTRNKIRKTRLGMLNSPGTRIKMSNAKKGKRLPQSTIDAAANANRGKHPIMSEKQKKDIKLAKSVLFYMIIYKNRIKYISKNLKEFCKVFVLDQGTMSHILAGRKYCHTHKGYSVKYMTKEEEILYEPFLQGDIFWRELLEDGSVIIDETGVIK